MGITATYDGLESELRQAIELRERLLRRVAWWPRRWTLLPALRMNLTAKLPESVQTKMVDRASDEDRDNPLFGCVTASYWVEEMADHCRNSFELDKQTVGALKSIQEARQTAFLGFYRYFRLGTIVGVIIAVFGFLASQIPKETFEELGWPHAYGWYRLVLFVFLVILLIYAVAFSLMARPVTRRVLQVSSTAGLVLGILAALYGADDQGAPTSSAPPGHPPQPH
jgi:hypothetical protein